MPYSFTKKSIVLIAIFLLSFGLVANEKPSENNHNSEATINIKPGANLNLTNVPIRVLISAISDLTGKNFIIDPIVDGKVSFISGKQIPENQLYDTFLIILQAYNYEAVEVGNNLFRIMPNTKANQTNTKIVDYPDVQKSPSLVITIINLEFIGVMEAYEILRPLIPDQSHLAVYQPNNSLIVSASEQTINQIRTILKNIDVDMESNKIDLIKLENSSVMSVLRVLDSLSQSKSEALKNIIFSADERTNNILIRGRKIQRDEIKKIIKQLDVRQDNNNNIEIFKLNYLTATETAEVLNNLMQSVDSSQENQAIMTSEVNIQANEATNSLIVRANNVQIKTIRNLIAKIDVEKHQVLVEAIIADISDDFASEIGVQWAGIKDGRYIGSINFSASSNSINGLGGNFVRGRNDLIIDSLGSGAVAGLALGNWGVLLNALENNSNANVLSRPSIVTLDNQEAEIFVGENVPFITSSIGGDNPTTNVERVEVGIKLKVKPKINPNKKVTMEIEQEISALSPSAQSSQAVDLITQSRKINTQVSMDDREIIVLGGLSSDQNSQVNQDVPLLSKIPILGKLFSYQTEGISKQSLMIFLRVVILPENSIDKISEIYNREIAIPSLNEPPQYKKTIDSINQESNQTDEKYFNQSVNPSDNQLINQSSSQPMILNTSLPDPYQLKKRQF